MEEEELATSTAITATTTRRAPTATQRAQVGGVGRPGASRLWRARRVASLGAAFLRAASLT